MTDTRDITTVPPADGTYSHVLALQDGRVRRLDKAQLAGTITGVDSLAAVADSVDRLAMTPAERSKLDGISAGAQVNPPALSVAERDDGTGTAARTMSAADVGALAKSAVGELTLIPAYDQRNVPPASPPAGRRFLIGAAPTGVWTGRAGQVGIVAADGTYTYQVGVAGSRIIVTDYNGVADSNVVFTTADGVLWTHEGYGQVNADQVVDTASKVLMTPAERSKLGGVQAGAQVNPTDLDGIPDSAARVAMTPAERSKLAAVEAGAQVNPTNLDGVPDSAARVAMTPAERSKLAAVEAGAQVNPAQVSAGEIAAGTGTAVRGFSPADAKAVAAAVAASGWTFYDHTVVQRDVTGQPASPAAQEFLTISGGGQLQVPAGKLAFDGAQVQFEIEGYRRFSAGSDGATGSANHTLTISGNGTPWFQDTFSALGFGTGDVPWMIRLRLTRRGANLDLWVQVAVESSGSTPPSVGSGGNISSSAAPAWPWGWAYSISGVDFDSAISLSATLTPPNMSAWVIPTVSPWNGSAATEPMWRWVKTQIDGRMVGIGPQGPAGAGGSSTRTTYAGASVSLLPAQVGQEMWMTGSSPTITLDGSTSWAVGDRAEFVALGGPVTIAVVSPAVLHQAAGDTLVIPQWCPGEITCVASNEYLLIGRTS